MAPGAAGRVQMMITPEFATKMRSQRPGYDRIYALIQRYDELPSDKRTQLNERELNESYVQPMFQALGWSVWVNPLSIEGGPAPLDLELEYENLQIPVEVKAVQYKLDFNSTALRQWRGGSTWVILTNFEIIQTWDLDQEKIILETSPWSYIADESEEHELMAAPVFYERLAQPRLAQSSDAAGADSDSGVPEETAEAAAKSDDLRELERMTAALSDSNESIRQAAVEALGQIGDPRAVEPLIAALSDANESMRQAVVQALGKIGDSRAVEPLIGVLSDPNESIRQTAIEALGRIGHPLAVRPLIAFLSDPNDSIRLAAVEALGQMNISQAAEPLIRALEDENAGVRQAAATALERAGTPSDSVPPDTTEQITIAVRALADTPSKVDLLGFSVYAEALADFIKNEKTEKPLTIGIDAAWGMGKTTLMQMVRDRLTETGGNGRQERAFLTVWFNAWKYDQEESLWAALALEILAQIQEQYDWRQRAQLWWKLNYRRLDWALLLRSVLKSLAYFVAIFFLGAAIYLIAALWLGIGSLWQYLGTASVLSVVAALYTVGKDAYQRVAGQFDLRLSEYVREPNYKVRVGFLAEFEEDFRRMIEVVTQGGKWPLVVFIDDLDRCAPPKPAEITEAINILLDAEHCVFVIGMDAQAVAASIEAKYKDLQDYLGEQEDPGGLTLGQLFLEKIIQISFRIPRAEQQRVESFIDANLVVSKAGPSKEPLKEDVAQAEQLIQAEQRTGRSLDEATSAVEEARPDLPREAVVEARQQVFAQSFDDSAEVRRAIHEAAPYLRLNPRKIKRFMNTFRLQALIGNRQGLLQAGHIQLELLARAVVIAMRWPDLVPVIISDPNFVNRLQEAQKLRDKLQALEGHGIPGRPDATPGRDPDEEAMLRARLDVSLTEPNMKRYIVARDLIDMLLGMQDSEKEKLPQHLQLARTTIERSDSRSPA